MRDKEPGYVYILINPSFREDWVKIGKSSRPVDVRSKELDNTAVPLPFEIYATLRTVKYDKVEKQIHKEKLYIPADSELVKTLLHVYKEHTGIDGKPVCIGGGTYAKGLPNILAFGPIFPGDEVREHKPDEFIEIPKLMKNAQIIASAMYEMAK